MKKLLLALLLLPFVACKKDNDKQLLSEYAIRVKCTDCVISLADLGYNNRRVKGTLDIPYNSVPSVTDFEIWSYVANDMAEVTFLGRKYDAIQLFNGVLKLYDSGYDTVHRNLPPKN
jgi:hypothetical protein